MAFPLDPTHLRAHLRALLLSNDAENETVSSVIRPLELGLFHDDLNKLYFQEFRSVSPPIPYDINEKVPVAKLTIRLSHRRGESRTKRKQRKQRDSLPQVTENKSVNPTGGQARANTSNSLVNTILLDSEGPVESVEKKHKEKQATFSKLFAAGPSILGQLKKQESKGPQSPTFTSDVISSTSLDLSRTNTITSRISSNPGLDRILSLGSIETGRPSLQNEDITENEISDNDTIERITNSDATSSNNFDSTSYSSSGSLRSSSSLNSSDSQVPRFDQKSLRSGNSNMMYNYSVPESYLLARNNDMLFGTSLQGQQMHAEGSESQVSNSKLQNSETKDLLAGDTIFAKQDIIHFEKKPPSDLVQSSKQSVLSSLINFRQEVINENPLAYFSFVSPESLDSEVKTGIIDVFVPPKTTPLLKCVSVITSVSIFDCIGYFISQIISTEEFSQEKNDKAFMDPNSWRMELIDSDGDLYDSTFGVLDRTRLLSSYNCPKFLGLCRVTNTAELAKNAKQTPLPLDFRQNLDAYQQHASALSKQVTETLPDQGMIMISENSVEIQVRDVPNQRKGFIKMFVSPKMQVGGLFDMICRQYQVNQSEFKLVGVDVTHIPTDIYMSDLISDARSREGQEIDLESASTVDELGIFIFKLVPASKQIEMSSVITGGGFSLRAGITPDLNSFIQSGITPPKPGLSRVYQKEEISSTAKNAIGTKEIKTRLRASEFIFDNHNFDDQFRNKSPVIPPAINTVYFKWKVFRKKPPLLNRIEKSLIIDGDYIHIVPADDVNLKKTSNDVLYGSHSESKHHHHYLHHYNYSKYYNDTMMKTSSFHVSQIVKVKKLKRSKNPLLFKIVIEKDTDHGGKDAVIQKKYDLEAENEESLKEMLRKIEWVHHSYERSTEAK